MFGYTIEWINAKKALPFILTKHYAKRKPSISYAYGLFNINHQLVGICTIGKPASYTLCNGVCGLENTTFVYELNRLFIKDGLEKNLLSFFVGNVLKRLAKLGSFILVSYADTQWHHTGYIYQATNWIYTGQTKARTDRQGKNNSHSRHNFGDKNLRVNRSSKHRYIYFVGKYRKKFAQTLRYAVLPYPKAENQRYLVV